MKAVAKASQACAEIAAAAVLEEGGTAVDAVIAGFFAAAGAGAGVLLGPVQALVAGPGVGPRAFDGRSRQPGRGLPRPRGLTEGQAVSPAALVAVPAALAALSLAHAYDGLLPIERLVAHGVAEAKKRGKNAREAAMRRIGAVGAAAIRDPRIARALLGVAGRVQGGLLSEEDLIQLRPVSAAPFSIDLGDQDDDAAKRLERWVLLTPWPAPETQYRVAEVLAAGDSRGVLAVLAYAPDEDGVDVPDLELCAPRDAVVVRRGVPRVSPGAPIGCPAPIAIAMEKGRPVLAAGLVAGRAISPEAFARAWGKPGAAAPALLRAAAEATGATKAVAVVRSLGKKEMKGLSL